MEGAVDTIEQVGLGEGAAREHADGVEVLLGDLQGFGGNIGGGGVESGDFVKQTADEAAGTGADFDYF